MTDALRQVDANLLLSLHALLEERNLTHAGERMTMSQPAMSGALARLRKHFDDELLVRPAAGSSCHRSARSCGRWSPRRSRPPRRCSATSASSTRRRAPSSST